MIFSDQTHTPTTFTRVTSLGCVRVSYGKYY